MRYISKILFIVTCGLSLFGISSCNDDFLSVDHYAVLPPDQMFKSDKDAKAGLIGCYDLMLPSGDVDGDGNADYNGDWGFKPNLFVGGHPTMDTQATGWDKDWNTQSWTAGSPELLSGWKQCYAGITRCNNFISGLAASENVTPTLKTSLDGQAKCIRAFFYMWLAKTFGRVPLLVSGETYINTPNKARAKDFTEMWDYIITDLKDAVNELGWDPADGEYGRCTKGFALSYLGEAYMWKAYRLGENTSASKPNYTLAKDALKQVVESGKYELNPSFTTLWDPGAVWTKESIWEEVLDEGSQWNSWANLKDAHAWVTYFTTCPAVGGWGSLYLSWEWWSSYEPGDKRRDASGITGAIPGIPVDWKSATNYGYNPYLQQSIVDGDGLTSHYHFYKDGEAAPSIWSLKYSRTCRADWNAMWGPQQIYYKRYANVLFDYAECLFRLNGDNDATAWGIIGDIRDRAFGNKEVGKKAELTAKYLPYYQQVAAFYESKRNPKDNPIPILVPTAYPLPFTETTVTVPDAKTYYAQVKTDKSFSSPVWLVALGMERRKEFNAEWCLAQDLIRSGFIEDHITHNYPKGVGHPNTNPIVKDEWNTYRGFDFNMQKMDMPIPTEELLKNTLCDQNDAYK